MQNFVIVLAESDHQSAFRHDTLFREVAQRLQTGAVLRPGAHHGGQSLDGFDVVPDDVGLRRRDRVQKFGAGVEIGNKELNYGVGILRADGLHRGGPMAGAAVREVVARHGCYDDIPEFHQCDAFGHAGGLSGVGGEGTSRSGGAEAAAPRADVAQNHEGRGPPAPAFRLVGAHAAATDRVQPVLLDDMPHLGPFRGTVEPDLQPSGFFQCVRPVIKLRHLSSLFSN